MFEFAKKSHYNQICCRLCSFPLGALDSLISASLVLQFYCRCLQFILRRRIQFKGLFLATTIMNDLELDLDPNR